MSLTKCSLILFAALLFETAGHSLLAQDDSRPTSSQLEDPKSILWLNTYGNIRLSNRFFWIAQTHFRFQETSTTPFAGQIAQIYNRHAISYLFSKSFVASFGGVLRINFNTSDEVFDNNAVPEWRIWHQYKFAMPLGSTMVYHRLRIEHRWSKGFSDESQYFFRNRWRYMFRIRVPLNKPKLSPKAWYIAPEAEIIMQSGKAVVDSPMEDLRLHTSLGYIVNPRLTFAGGLMYSIGQELVYGAFYRQKWALRFHVYFSPDWRKVKYKLPAINMNE